MSRAAGRRVAERPGRGNRAPRPRRERSTRPPRTPRESRPPREGAGGSLVLVLVLVVIVGAAVFLTGTTEQPAGRTPVAEQETRSARSLSCTGDLPGTMALVGTAGSATSGLTVDGKAPAAKPVQVGSSPIRVEASASVAGSAFAVQSAGAKWLAAQPCPEARAEWWFAGAGASGVHDSVLTLDNPRAGDAVVDIDVLGPHGAVQAPGLHGMPVAGGDTVHLDLGKVAPSVGDLAVHVTASRGLVAASMSEHWAPDFATKPVQSWVSAQPPAGTDLTLAGLPDGSRHAELLVANPSSTAAVVKIRLVNENGTFRPTKDADLTVPPDAVSSVSLDDSLRAKPYAVRVESQVPVAATVRSRADNDESYATAVAPLLDGSSTGVPARVSGAAVRLVSTGGSGTADLTTYGAAGKVIDTQQVKVPAAGGVSVSLPGKVRALKLTSREGSAIVGSLVLSGGGIDALPLNPTGQESKIPAVVAGF